MSMQCTDSDTHYEHRVEHTHTHTQVRTTAMKMQPNYTPVTWVSSIHFNAVIILFCHTVLMVHFALYKVAHDICLWGASFSSGSACRKLAFAIF